MLHLLSFPKQRKQLQTKERNPRAYGERSLSNTKPNLFTSLAVDVEGYGEVGPARTGVGNILQTKQKESVLVRVSIPAQAS